MKFEHFWRIKSSPVISLFISVFVILLFSCVTFGSWFYFFNEKNINERKYRLNQISRQVSENLNSEIKLISSIRTAMVNLLDAVTLNDEPVLNEVMTVNNNMTLVMADENNVFLGACCSTIISNHLLSKIRYMEPGCKGIFLTEKPGNQVQYMGIDHDRHMYKTIVLSNYTIDADSIVMTPDKLYPCTADYLTTLYDGNPLWLVYNSHSGSKTICNSFPHFSSDQSIKGMVQICLESELTSERLTMLKEKNSHYIERITVFDVSGVIVSTSINNTIVNDPDNEVRVTSPKFINLNTSLSRRMIKLFNGVRFDKSVVLFDAGTYVRYDAIKDLDENIFYIAIEVNRWNADRMFYIALLSVFTIGLICIFISIVVYVFRGVITFHYINKIIRAMNKAKSFDVNIESLIAYNSWFVPGEVYKILNCLMELCKALMTMKPFFPSYVYTSTESDGEELSESSLNESLSLSNSCIDNNMSNDSSITSSIESSLKSMEQEDRYFGILCLKYNNATDNAMRCIIEKVDEHITKVDQLCNDVVNGCIYYVINGTIHQKRAYKRNILSVIKACFVLALKIVQIKELNEHVISIGVDINKDESTIDWIGTKQKTRTVAKDFTSIKIANVLSSQSSQPLPDCNQTTKKNKVNEGNSVLSNQIFIKGSLYQRFISQNRTYFEKMSFKPFSIIQFEKNNVPVLRISESQDLNSEWMYELDHQKKMKSEKYDVDFLCEISQKKNAMKSHQPKNDFLEFLQQYEKEENTTIKGESGGASEVILEKNSSVIKSIIEKLQKKATSNSEKKHKAKLMKRHKKKRGGTLKKNQPYSKILVAYGGREGMDDYEENCQKMKDILSRVCQNLISRISSVDMEERILQELKKSNENIFNVVIEHKKRSQDIEKIAKSRDIDYICKKK